MSEEEISYKLRDIPNLKFENEDLDWIAKHSLFEWKFVVANRTWYIYSCQIYGIGQNPIYLELFINIQDEQIFYINCRDMDVLEIFEELIKIETNLVYYVDIFRKYFR